jgi:hypothetical protein
MHLHQTTTLTPEQYVAGLTDLGLAVRSCSATAPTSTSRCIKRASRRPTSRKAREASGNACITTGRTPTASSLRRNVWGGASSHTYTFTRRPDVATDIDVVVVREGKNVKGWVLGLVLGTVGRRVLQRAFEHSVKAIEMRNGSAPANGAASRSVLARASM